MGAALNDELCRITVTGPDRRIDLAVPATTPVANLLPVLVEHTTNANRTFEGAVPEQCWVLQRVGQVPFALTGTPESLDWLDGEELYLRPAEDPLPELDFDDIADGVATVVNRRTDRWRPEYRRALFLVLATLAMGTIATVLVDRGPVLYQVVLAGALAVALMLAAVLNAARSADAALAGLFACGAAGFAAVAGASLVDGDPDGVSWPQQAILAAAVGAVTVAALLLLAQRTIAGAMPFLPLLVICLTAGVVIQVLLTERLLQLSEQEAAAAAVVVVFGVAVLAPRVAVKSSRLRGPQLPRTGEELSYDIEPAKADVVQARTRDAEAYLTSGLVAAALVLPVLFGLTMRVPGWSGWTLVATVSVALLLGARAHYGLWQRLALVAGGTIGALMVVLRGSEALPDGWRLLLLGGLVALLVALVLAAQRPWPRRMLPIWEYTATFLDVITGLAVLPLLAQVLGLYAWARGLFG